MKFYTSVTTRGNNILYRGISGSLDIVSKVPFKPTLFVTTKSEDTEWKSLYGDAIEPVTFADISEARDFVKRYEGVHGFDIFGNFSYEYQYIVKNFLGEVEYDFSKFKIYTIDIETELPPVGEGEGFPNIETANCAINLITLLNNQTKEAVTFGIGEWKDRSGLTAAEKVEGYDVEYFSSVSEADMLRKFVHYWETHYPHFYTGWNTETFDTPYLINRLVRILGESEARKLSPFGILNNRKITAFNREVQTYDIVGVVELDYLSLFKKFTYGNQESYSLEYISSQELGTGKLKFDCSFREAYEQQWDTFVSYNIIDTIRVHQLDAKFQFIQLAVIMAYMMKCNVRDVFGVVRPWDCMIHGQLYDRKIAIPQKRAVASFDIEGGYVKDPNPGLYKWIMSFDYTSLYPSIVRQWNISPETLVSDLAIPITITPNDIINPSSDFRFQLTSVKEFGYCIAANGSMYRQDKKGIIPYLMEYLMVGRKTVKKEMLLLEQEYEKSKDKSLLSRIAMLNGKQMAFKIAANAGFGAMANMGFRYFDPKLAEAITLTGQASIKHLAHSFNKYLNDLFKTNEDYVIAIDTDSNYLNVNSFVERFCKDKSIEETTAFLDKVGKQLQQVIDKSCSDIRELTLCEAKVIGAKREAIASQGLFQKKKRYALVVHNSEGVEYKPHKIKIMGLDLIKSSTPKVIRADLKSVLEDIFFVGKSGVQEKIQTIRSAFMNMSPNDIAFPRGITDMTKWTDSKGNYKLSTPIHVRGAILYNNLTAKDRDHYSKLRDGDKVKFMYLKVPNPIKEDVISWPASGDIPKELEKYIDYEKMWNKVFISPVEGLLDAIGWDVEEQADLSEFFG